MLMKHVRTIAVAFSAMMLTSLSAAQAATVTVDQTLDLTAPKFIPGPGFQGWQDTPAFNGGLSFDLSEGDTLDYTIDFLGAQTLTLMNATSLWAFIYSGSPSSDVTGTGTLSLLDSNGDAFLTSNIKVSTEGSVHFGQDFGNADFAGGLAGSLMFSGLRYVGTLDDYVLDGTTTRSYNTPAFFLNADDAIVGGVVPEPATWAMMIIGFGAAGSMIRRRKAVVA